MRACAEPVLIGKSFIIAGECYAPHLTRVTSERKALLADGAIPDLHCPVIRSVTIREPSGLKETLVTR